MKGDKKIIAIATNELVAKEAPYHPCCYRKYTVTFNNSQRENKNETSLIQEAFDAAKHVLQGLYEVPNITEFSDLTNKAVESLHDLNQDDVSNIRRHLRRKIENEMDGINFITVKNRVLVFPETLSTSVVVKRLYEKEIELERVQKMTSDEKSIFPAASTIRAQVRNMECKMPWPPQAVDLKTENIELGEYLSMSLNSLLYGKFSMQSSERVNRLRLSIGHDLLYAILNGILRTPKSILFPYMIKTLTNCKELINIINRLGHDFDTNG